MKQINCSVRISAGLWNSGEHTCKLFETSTKHSGKETLNQVRSRKVTLTLDNRYLHLIRQDCPLPPGTHVVIYCRDSGGDEQDRSVAQQINVAREYCQHHNLVLDKLYVDESKLSSNTEKRDALQELLSDLRRRFKHINDRYKREKASRENPFGVIFWKSNRLGRDSIEATNIKTDLRLRAITIVDLVTSANTGNAAVSMRSSKPPSSGRMSRTSKKSLRTLSAD